MCARTGRQSGLSQCRRRRDQNWPGLTEVKSFLTKAAGQPGEVCDACTKVLTGCQGNNDGVTSWPSGGVRWLLEEGTEPGAVSPAGGQLGAVPQREGVF